MVAAAAEIQRRKVIQRAGRADAREQPVVLLVPEAVRLGRCWDGRLFCGFRGGWRVALVLGEHRWRTKQTCQSHQNSDPEFAHLERLLSDSSTHCKSASSITVHAARRSFPRKASLQFTVDSSQSVKGPPSEAGRSSSSRLESPG